MSEKNIKRLRPDVRDDIGDLVTQRPLPGKHGEQMDPYLFTPNCRRRPSCAMVVGWKFCSSGSICPPASRCVRQLTPACKRATFPPFHWTKVASR